SICLLCLCLRPLLSTLVPYPTLFRSLPALGKSFLQPVALFGGEGRGIAQRHPVRLRQPRAIAAQAQAQVPRPGNIDHADHSVPPDRKSTRLNSSHVKISYTVICLKKK